jgi:hypothetical protein
VRAGATRIQHYTRQLALLVILGRPARYAVAWTGCRRRAANERLAGVEPATPSRSDRPWPRTRPLTLSL